MSTVGRHRAASRPRYGRISVLATSVAVTLVAVLGASGVLPSTLVGDTDPSASVARDPAGAAGAARPVVGAPAPSASPAAKPVEDEAQEQVQEKTGEQVQEKAGEEAGEPAEESASDAGAADTALPADSGEGRRVVYSISRQRVWLVEDADRVARTYLVSGTVHDNLDPGTFEVFSRSEDAVGIDDSGTMKYFVRFTRGPSGAAIGFHDIPVDDGRPVQTVAELGTPQSHGCIRQRRADAIVLWEFAPIGTTVVVTA